MVRPAAHSADLLTSLTEDVAAQGPPTFRRTEDVAAQGP